MFNLMFQERSRAMERICFLVSGVTSSFELRRKRDLIHSLWVLFFLSVQGRELPTGVESELLSRLCCC